MATIHYSAIEKALDAVLVAVCDIDEKAAKKAAAENGFEKYYTSLEEMHANEEIDAVNVCTPSCIHADIAVVAAAHKKHILCEKPLEVTKERMEHMINACKENGVTLAGVFQRRNTDMVQMPPKL